MNRSKISIIGGGFVGSTCAQGLLNRDLGDIVLLDIEESMVQGRSLDLLQSSALMTPRIQINGTADYKNIQDSDIVVITAGQARKPGMSRDELQNINAKIVIQVCEQIKKQAPQSCVIVVTNPLDVMTYVAWKTLGFPSDRVIGMAGVLDSARFKTFVAQELNVSVRDVQAFVLGGHGDTMVLLPRLCHVGGIPLSELLSKERIDSLVERAKKGGAEIVSLLKTSSAYYAPALSVVEMVESILKDQKRILPCSTLLKGEYGVTDLFMGVLCLLGTKGVEKIMEFSMSVEEKAQFQNSVLAVKKQVQQLRGLV
ncbi:MAG: malate dehydrogenase [Bdellovibrionaceae bacterium]|nr:malate dehydrogenase [Pseudobdellovibrionaceae bacterium]